MPVDVKSIVELLRSRHRDDVLVLECKDGPSQGTSHNRMDAWAMRRSWSKPCTWGYEIKVSRSDFQRDDKWHRYLGYCNEFYFVAPFGLLKPSELPAEAGLLEASLNGRVLRRRKKASHRDVQIDECFWRYLLMCRTRIVDRDVVSKEDYWREWLEKKVERREFGHRVSRGIRETVETQIESVKQKNRELREENEQLSDVRETLAELGFEKVPEYWGRRGALEAAIKRLADPLRELQGVCGQAVCVLNRVAQEIEKVKG
jgi:hypothetical protein